MAGRDPPGNRQAGILAVVGQRDGSGPVSSVAEYWIALQVEQGPEVSQGHEMDVVVVFREFGLAFTP
jgi:hypothetical protein